MYFHFFSFLNRNNFTRSQIFSININDFFHLFIHVRRKCFIKLSEKLWIVIENIDLNVLISFLWLCRQDEKIQSSNFLYLFLSKKRHMLDCIMIFSLWMKYWSFVKFCKIRNKKFKMKNYLYISLPQK